MEAEKRRDQSEGVTSVLFDEKVAE